MVNTSSDRKKKNLKGVVLIMVVTVMMVLIVMLLATLAAVSTAQSRYYSKYEENQAYYSARSALEVVQQCQFTDSNYIAYDTSGSKRYETGYDKEGNLVTMEMTQGLGMQFTLARLKAHSDTMDNYYAMADQTQFSTDFWANPGVNGNTIFTDTNCTATAYYENPDKEYIEFKVRFPAVSNGSEKFGGFVDQEDPTDPDSQIATIRFEVLARTYDGHDPKLQDKINANPGMASVLIANDIDNIRNGNRSKDKTYYKATVFTECQGTQQSASVVYYPKEKNEDFESAVTTVGFIGGVDNGIVIDGYATPDDLPLGNMGVYVGESYVGGEVTTPGGGSAFAMSEGQVTYLKTLASVTNNFYPIALGLTDMSDYSEVPLVFVDGDCNFNNSLTWARGSSGTRANQVDLVCMGDLNVYDINSNGNFFVNGDVHLQGNNMSFSTDTSLVVNGDLYIESANIQIPANTVYVLGDVYFSFTPGTPSRYQELFLIEGATVDANGVLYEAMNTGFVQDNLGSALFSYNTLTSDANPFGNLDATSEYVQTEEGAEIILPSVTTISYTEARIEDNSSNANYSRMVPCFTSKYESFWKVDTDGNYIMNGSDHVYVSAEEYAGSTSSDRETGNYTEKSFDAPADAESLPSFGEASVVGEANFIMYPGNYDLKITGGGVANIYVEEGYYRGNILSDDETFVNFYFKNGVYTWIMANYTQSVYDGFTSGLRFGKKDDARIPTPRIYFYASSGAVINATEAGKCLFTGYIYAPEATINTVKGRDGSYTYYYNEAVVVNNDGNPMNCPPIIIGSVFCNNLSVSQNSATCFVPPDEIRVIGKPLFENTERWYFIDQ